MILFVILLICYAFGKAVETITYNMIASNEERHELHIYTEEDYSRHPVRRKSNTRRLYRKRQ